MAALPPDFAVIEHVIVLVLLARHVPSALAALVHECVPLVVACHEMRDALTRRTTGTSPDAGEASPPAPGGSARGAPTACDCNRWQRDASP